MHEIILSLLIFQVNLSGLRLTFSSTDLGFVNSKPDEVERFFQDAKVLSTNSRRETQKLRLPSLKIFKPGQNITGIFAT